MVILYTPFTKDVDEYLFEQFEKESTAGKLLHLVPTMILFRKRNLGYKKKARLKKLTEENLQSRLVLNEFQRWAREYMYQRLGEKVLLSPSESHVLVRRAIRCLFPDRRDWLYVSREIVDLFAYFQTSGRTLQELKDVYPFTDWQQLLALYEQYKALLYPMKDGWTYMRELFEQATFEEYRELVLDGPFLFFDPIHELLIRRFQELGKPVTMIVPYDRVEGKTNPAYRVIEKTYEAFLPVERWKRIGRIPYSSSSYIANGPKVLFSDDPAVFRDDSLQLHRFPGVEQELHHVISEISKLTKKGVLLRDIAIVTPHSMQMRPLVREISEHYDLPVEVPERSLLGMTDGEFIHMIYQTRIDERRLDQETFFSVDMFVRMLTSQWLAGSETTFKAFQNVTVFFDTLRSLDEWELKLEQMKVARLKLQPGELRYHPLHGVTLGDLKCWHDIIHQFVSIQETLFARNTATIREHANALMDQLTRMAERNGWHQRDALVAFFERLQAIADRLSSQNQLPMATSEFAELIAGLFQEQEDEPEGTQQDEVTEDVDGNRNVRGVLVTGTQNIAFQQYKYLYITQFTQSRYPKASSTVWPRLPEVEWKLRALTTSLPIQTQREYSQLLSDRERYYFYMTLLSVQNEYSVSYSRAERGQQNTPSLYLHDLARSFGVENNEEPHKLEDMLIAEGILRDMGYLAETQDWSEEVSAEADELIPKRTAYRLEELAAYKLCPKRFWYGQMYPDRQVYSSAFQLAKYMAAVLYEATALQLMEDLKHKRLVEDKEAKRQQGNLLGEVPQRVVQQIEQFADLFPVHEGIWEESRFYGVMATERLINNMFEAFVNHKDQAFFSVEMLDGPKQHIMKIQCDAKTFEVYSEREVVMRNTGMVRSYALRDAQEFLVLHAGRQGVRNVNEQSFGQWFLKLKRDFFYDSAQSRIQKELKELFEEIQSGHFQKQAGEHCLYCPFRLECQEREIVQELEFSGDQGEGVGC